LRRYEEVLKSYGADIDALRRDDAMVELKVGNGASGSTVPVSQVFPGSDNDSDTVPATKEEKWFDSKDGSKTIERYDRLASGYSSIN
jgi:hypothetical protein